MADYIVCYDICDPRRLVRVHRRLRRFATPIQYSVFLFSGDERQLRTNIDEIVSLIDPSCDDLRVYPLPARGLRLRIGRAALPDGIQYSALPPGW